MEKLVELMVAIGKTPAAFLALVLGIVAIIIVLIRILYTKRQKKRKK